MDAEDIRGKSDDELKAMLKEAIETVFKPMERRAEQGYLKRANPFTVSVHRAITGSLPADDNCETGYKIGMHWARHIATDDSLHLLCQHEVHWNGPGKDDDEHFPWVMPGGATVYEEAYAVFFAMFPDAPKDFDEGGTWQPAIDFWRSVLSALGKVEATVTIDRSFLQGFKYGATQYWIEEKGGSAKPSIDRSAAVAEKTDATEKVLEEHEKEKEERRFRLLYEQDEDAQEKGWPSELQEKYVLMQLIEELEKRHGANHPDAMIFRSRLDDLEE